MLSSGDLCPAYFSIQIISVVAVLGGPKLGNFRGPSTISSRRRRRSTAVVVAIAAHSSGPDLRGPNLGNFRGPSIGSGTSTSGGGGGGSSSSSGSSSSTAVVVAIVVHSLGPDLQGPNLGCL